MRTFCTAVILSFSLFAFAQTDNSKIIKIREAVEHINKDSGYIIKKLDADKFMEETTDNGAELTAYFKNNELVKIVEWVGLSSCISVTEYYLKNNKLIFTYTKGSEHPYSDSLQTLDYNKLVMTMECRFYFENDKLIKSILKGSTHCAGEATVEFAEEDVKEYLRYKKLLLNK